jgi:hypothetical protein
MMWYGVVRDVHLHRAFRLHELDSESEESACFVAHHLEVVGFTWTRQAVTPVQIHALTSVEVEQLFCEYLNELWVVHEEQVLQRFEVDVVGGVYGLRNAED